MNLKTYLTVDYLFGINNVYVSPQEKMFFFVGATLVLLAAVLKIAAMLAPNPVDAKIREKFYRLLLYTGLGEVLWYALRYENVKFFGSRFLAWLIVLVGFILLVIMLVKAIRSYGAQKQAWDKEQVRLKYLPK